MATHFTIDTELIELLQLQIEFEETINFCSLMKESKTEKINMLQPEKEISISRLEQGVEYYDKLAELLCKLRQKSEYWTNENVDKKLIPLTNNSVKEQVSRKPMNMLRIKYKYIYENEPSIVNMKDLLVWFFRESNDIGYASTETITKLLYDTQTEKEFKKAKNSIAVQLRRGAKERRWQKIGRGYFASNKYQVESKNLKKQKHLLKKL